MTFKKNWERTESMYAVSDQAVEAMLALAIPTCKYRSHRIVSGGCANLNFKVQLEGPKPSLLLRIYLRDHKAAVREQRLAKLLHHALPIPEVYFVGDYDGQVFSIMEYKSGISLRDYLLDRDRQDMAALMEEAGRFLAKIHQFRWNSSGFFDENLSVCQPIDREDFIAFVEESVQHPRVFSRIGAAHRREIRSYFTEFAQVLPGIQECCLVHADYDPANILVDRQNGRWGITAILDWEFAFSGSALVDVATMLRYSHQMPKIFEDAFLGALRDAGMVFPKEWRICVHLLNVLSLLDCLVRCPLNERPNQCADICHLIEHICKRLANAGMM